MMHQLLTFSLVAGMFMFGKPATPGKTETPATTKAAGTLVEPLRTPPPPLFRCGGQKGTSQVKCTAERKKTLYYFTTKSLGSNKYDIRIEAVLGGASTLVYSSTIHVIDKRAASSEYVVQIQLSKKLDYRWDISHTDALVGTYNLKTNKIAFEARGKMKDYYDAGHGLGSEYVKANVTPPHFDQDNVVKAVAAYFIFEYYKAIDMNIPSYARKKK